MENPNSLFEQTADDLGIDSLIAVEFRSWFLRELEVDMPVLKILGGATLAEIANHAVKNLPRKLTVALTADDGASVASATKSIEPVDTPRSNSLSNRSLFQTESRSQSSASSHTEYNVVTEDDSKPSQQSITNSSLGESSHTPIDWVHETTVESSIESLKAQHWKIGKNENVTVALTGSTGFLGKHVLQRLVRMDNVKRIYCLAVRNIDKLEGMDLSKVVVCKGDLSADNLGLSTQQAEKVFQEANVVIHNGANVTFLKSYRKMKALNFSPTKALVELALTHGNVRQFHFVSSASVGQVTTDEELYEESVSGTLPPPDGASGYTVTKWASEAYLENVSKSTNLGVWIHRPSSIVGEGAPQNDLLLNILHYSKKIKAVPNFKRASGWFQFVEVDEVANDITDQLYSEIEPSPYPITYLHHPGTAAVNVHGLKGYAEKLDGQVYEVITQEEWNLKAQQAGLPQNIAAYLEVVDNMNKLLQKICKGKRINS